MQPTKEYESPFTFRRSDVIELHINNSNIYTELDLERLFSFDYNIVNIQEEENLRLGIIDLSFKMTAEKSNENVLELNAVIRGLFTVGRDVLSEDDFKTMLEYNGVTALYGISRGVFTSISSVAFSNEVIRLPMLNIVKIIENKHKLLEKSK